ncbi:MAG TPA: DUF3313 domain-containing protein [Thermoanaerobaculia bacterium]|nr:DUF3313 domain-containing protein [Thermoanaerobaculia bacterium]
MKRPASGATVLLVLFAAALGGSGCIQKAKPATPAGFIPDKELEKPSDLPFQKAWRKKDLDWRHYTAIYIAPWNTEYLRQMNWWEKLERGEKVKEDAKELAGYARGVFEEAFRNDRKHRFTVLEQPGPNTLVVEFALTEVIPNKVVLDALGYAAGPVVGAAGTAAANVQTATTHSTVAFEARVKDGATNEVVAMFADRESEKFSLVNVKDLTWYGHAKAILREWADQFVKITNKQPGEIVKDSAPFDLKPW